MSLTLLVDADRWRAHLTSTVAAMPGLVPVVKGEGYGFGCERLAAVAAGLAVDTIAVGEPHEVALVRPAYAGDVLVMAPWRPGRGAGTETDPGVLRTVAHLDALHALSGSGARVVVECLTSMRRHGIAADQLPLVAPLLDGLRCEGFALHLPIDRPRGSESDEVEVASSIARLQAAGLAPSRLWVSHLTRAEHTRLRERFPDIELRPRVGTALWLGEPASYRARSTVLDVRTLAAGERYGYRQQRRRRPATLLVLSGGTSHGVGLEAPKAARGVVARARLLGTALLSAGGHNLSPFTVAGRKRWFAEPPHMQVSLVLLPAGVEAPDIGSELDVTVRMTTSRFDAIEGL